jgi:hypothetical protein
MSLKGTPDISIEDQGISFTLRKPAGSDQCRHGESLEISIDLTAARPYVGPKLGTGYGAGP